MSRGHTPAWQAVRAARAARRAVDPEVAARRERHRQREAARIREAVTAEERR